MTKAVMIASAGIPARTYVDVAGLITSSPTRGMTVCPITPSNAVMITAISVNPTTQALRRWVASEIAPKIGIDNTTSTDEALLASAAIVFDVPISFTSHTAKNKVAMFIEKM